VAGEKRERAAAKKIDKMRKVAGRTAKAREEANEHIGRLSRRADTLRERIGARGGPNADTSSDVAELSSLEAAISLVDSTRWRRSIDEPIPSGVADILAAIVDNQDVTMILRRQEGNEWQCRCGCSRIVAEDHVYRWRPQKADAIGPRDDDAAEPSVGPASYRGRKRLAIIDDRIRHLAARSAELKQKGTPARYEKDEIEALTWIRELALREAADGRKRE
jgi:hypothetical protein